MLCKPFGDKITHSLTNVNPLFLYELILFDQNSVTS